MPPKPTSIPPAPAQDLSKLPPPPPGQKGITFDALKKLPPPPKTGERGFTIDELKADDFKAKSVADKTGISDSGVGKFGKTIFDFFTHATQELGQNAGQSIAAPENVQRYSDALDQWVSIDSNFNKMIKNMKDSGQDTSKYETTLKMHNESKPRLEDFVGIDTARRMREGFAKNLEEIAGQGAGTVLEALSGGLFESGAKTLVSKDLSIAQKALQGAKVGGAYGAASGASDAMSKKEGVGGVAESTVIGGALGSTLGAVAEGAGAKIGAKLEERAATKTEREAKTFLDKMWQKIQPDIKDASVAKATGRKVEEGRFSNKVLPNDRDVEKIKALETAGAKSSMKNIEIADKASERVTQLNRDVKAFIRQNDKDIPITDLQKSLNESMSSDEAKRAIVFGGSTELEKAYESMIQGFLGLAKGDKTKLSEIFDNRQVFDSLANKYIPKAFESEDRDTVKKVALRDIRNTVNKFVVDNIEGGEAIKGVLNEESLLLESIDDLESNTKVGQTILGKRTRKGALGVVTAIGGYKAGKALGIFGQQ